MSPTPPLFASPATVPRGPVDCARPPPDTSPRRTTTGATTTDPRRATHLHTTGAPHPGTVHRVPLDTSLHVHPVTAHQGPPTEAAGVGHRPGTAWKGTGPSMSATMSMRGTMSPLPMSKASLMETHIHMGGILTHTHAHLGLPAMGPLHPLTRIPAGCPMATAHPHLHHIVGDLPGHRPTLTTVPPMPEGPAKACMNLIARRTRMTGASNHWERGLRVLVETNSHIQCPGLEGINI